MDYLNDDKLEEMGYIKEIDTLAIVEKVSKIKEKRRKRLLKWILYGGHEKKRVCL
ncbi:hypothetical protein HF520_00720 [Romboutsia sp. CE17]|uniref:hypothetical protein n=1 Tax=Romboutsia sp. CE17 TaxID=2724150 RepID=UPI001442B06A|nr:hypothetical protein [Romboutsia sp. CE17]QJA07555.1 hypothetical protein HF520_00720 [Romboutsia sp. CE17]